MQRKFHQSQQSVTARASQLVPRFYNHDVVLQSLQVFGGQGKRHHLREFNAELVHRIHRKLFATYRAFW